MKSKKIGLALLLVLISLKGFTQVDTITINSKNLILEKIKPKKNTYLVYIEKPDGAVLDVSIWERTVSFTTFNSEKVIVVDQLWKNQEATKTRTIKSINSRKNFQPIYHYSKNGKGTIEAYTFLNDKIIGTDSVQNNTKKGFEMSNKSNTLNWELDLETYQLLPYKLNTAFNINFYHPGSKSMKPNYYTYSVIGEEKIKVSNQNFVDCWVLKIQHAANSSATYWIDKTTRETIKMIEVFGAIKRYKIKISNLIN
ncbi:MAG: hypothetical protein JKY44_00950 [Flavobacteriaceae bacterium]|nr:hypothetical protein [Flavobacteriaceae bacterium]